MKNNGIGVLIGILTLATTLAGLIIFISTTSQSSEMKLAIANSLLLLIAYILIFYNWLSPKSKK